MPEPHRPSDRTVAQREVDHAGLARLSDTLVLLMQQHNMKEEQILFPMAARLLAARLPALLDGLRPAAVSA